MIGEVIADRYEVEELVGSGGMSSVYRAHDRLLERTVALKILHEQYTSDESYVERFRREARAVAQLAHPNIVTVIDRGEYGGRQYIVFEYLDGENLKQRLRRSGPLSEPEAVELALGIARALASAHERGVVHRDVKPQNVLFTAEGEPKVTDFGIARSADVESVTLTGTVLGTSDYIAPEQARGEEVDVGTDVYSLGAVLYELLTGGVPFPGDSAVSVAMRHVNEPAPHVREARPEVSPRLEAVVLRAMAKDPAARFGSMRELIAELEACRTEGAAGDETVIVSPAPRPKRARPRRRRSRALPFLLVLLIAGAAVGALALAGVFDNGTPSASDGGATPIKLQGVGSHDPEGGDGEHDEAVARATDGDPETYWPTEQYQTFSKEGVGIVLNAGRSVSPSRLTVESSAPGFTARIDAGSDPGGPFQPVSSEQTVGPRTTFELEDVEAQYYVVWITALPGGFARVNEVTAR